jgi:hypothetical protein
MLKGWIAGKKTGREAASMVGRKADKKIGRMIFSKAGGEVSRIADR